MTTFLEFSHNNSRKKKPNILNKSLIVFSKIEQKITLENTYLIHSKQKNLFISLKVASSLLE